MASGSSSLGGGISHNLTEYVIVQCLLLLSVVLDGVFHMLLIIHEEHGQGHWVAARERFHSVFHHGDELFAELVLVILRLSVRKLSQMILQLVHESRLTESWHSWYILSHHVVIQVGQIPCTNRGNGKQSG